MRQRDGVEYVTSRSIHRFYRFYRLEADHGQLSLLSPVLVMKCEAESRSIYINTVRFILNDRVRMIDGVHCFSRLDLCKLIDPVLRPSYIATAMTFDSVVIDPAHGGADSGAQGPHGPEKAHTLAVALAVKAELEKRGFVKVLLTRATDQQVSVEDRVALASSTPNCIYIGLRCSTPDGNFTGLETFALAPEGGSDTNAGPQPGDMEVLPGNQHDSLNIALATALHAQAVNVFRQVDRGVKRARFPELKLLKVPAASFKIGLASDPEESALLASEKHRLRLAFCIAESVQNFKRALRPHPMPPPPQRAPVGGGSPNPPPTAPTPATPAPDTTPKPMGPTQTTGPAKP